MKKAVRLLVVLGIATVGLILVQQGGSQVAYSGPVKHCGLCVIKLDGSTTCDGVEWGAAGCLKQKCTCARTVYE